MSVVATSEAAQNFNNMRDFLVGLGAGERALAGTVVDLEQGIGFNAVFFVDSRPTQSLIAEFIPRDALTVLARVTLSPSGEPLANITRHHQELPTRPEDMLDHAGLPDLRGGEAGRRILETVYLNVLVFEPYTAS